MDPDTNPHQTPPPTSGGPFASIPTAPLPAAPVRSKRRIDLQAILLAVAALVAVGGVAFAAGRLTAPAQTAANRTGLGSGAFPGGGQSQGGGQGAGNGGFGNGLGRFGAGVTLEGTVVAVAPDHISLRLASGATVDIPIDSSTTWHRQTAATSADATAGVSVLIRLQPTGNGVGPIAPNASAAPDASGRPNPSNLSGGLGRLGGPAQDVTIVAP